MKIENIDYFTEPVEQYKSGLDKADTLDRLKAFLKDWQILCQDAYRIALQMDDKSFAQFREALAQERKGIFSDNKDATIIMMPETLFKISMLALQFKVPWGLMFHRLKDVSKLEIKEDYVKVLV